MAKVCQHCLVSGKVQGVWYRQTTKEMAERLKITGWVRNLPTGEVELMACGEEPAIEALCQWLWTGPSHATVHDVRCTEHAWQTFSAFTIV